MRLINNYDELCKLLAEGKVFPDVGSTYGMQSINYLRKKGWKIRRGIFRDKKTRNDLLDLCKQSKENFKLAYKEAGINFWAKEKKSKNNF